ncbi:hypothetical protein [Nostoc sp.]
MVQRAVAPEKKLYWLLMKLDVLTHFSDHQAIASKAVVLPQRLVI